MSGRHRAALAAVFAVLLLVAFLPPLAGDPFLQTLPLSALITIAVGYLVARWWVVVLGIIPALGAIPGGDDGDAPRWAVTLFIISPFVVALLAVGVALSKWRLARQRKSSSSSAPGTSART